MHKFNKNVTFVEAEKRKKQETQYKATKLFEKIGHFQEME